MIDQNELGLWFVAGSQHLYGQATLKQVVRHSQEMIIVRYDNIPESTFYLASPHHNISAAY